MPSWVQTLLLVCAVLVTVVLVVALLALRRAAERTEAVMRILEQELRPLIGQAHALTGDLRELTKDARGELTRIGVVTEQVHDLSAALGRLVGALAGLTRAGQVIGIATGLRKGLEVFVRQLRK